MVNSKLKVFSVIAVLALMFCAFAPMVNCETSDAEQTGTEEEKETYKYLSFGDSMTAGFGMADYSKNDLMGYMTSVEGTYEWYIANVIEEQIGDKYNVQHVPLAIGGMRSTDLRAIIDETFVGCDEYPGDDYTKGILLEGALGYSNVYAKAKELYPELAAQGLEGLPLLRASYQKELNEADFITYHQHLDFAYSLGLPVIGKGIVGHDVDYDFTLFFDSEFAAQAQQLYALVENVIVDYLKSQGVDISSYLDYIDMIIFGCAYAIVSYCSNYDAFMNYLAENNPDAKVMVIDTYMLVEDLTMSFGELELAVDDLYETLIGIGNYYVQYSSPYAAYAYHANIDEKPYLFTDEFRYLDVDNVPAAELKDCLSDEARANFMFALGQADAPATPEGVLAYNYLDAYGNLSKLCKCIFGITNIDVISALSGDTTELMKNFKIALGYISEGKDKCVVEYNAEDGSCKVSIKDSASEPVTLTATDLSTLFVALSFATAYGVLLHSGPVSNSTVAKYTIETILKDDILADGDRVYITAGEGEKTMPIIGTSKPGFSDLLVLSEKATLRGAINYTYANWNISSAFVHSEFYTNFYNELLQTYTDWAAYYMGGGVDEDLEKVHQDLISLDENWDSIFGCYAKLCVIKQLHLELQALLAGWDDIKSTVAEGASFINTVFGVAVFFLEPETFRAFLDDKVFTVSARECFLNISLNFDSFYDEICYDLEVSWTSCQAIKLITATIEKYMYECHESMMYEGIEPTCTEEGCMEHYVCKLCGSYFIVDESGLYREVTKEVVILPAHGHDCEEHPAVAATCKHAGNNLYYTCNDCGAVLKADKETVTTVEAETIPMLEHQHVKVPGVAPTATKTGLTEGDKCILCGEVFVKQEIIPATGTGVSEVTTTTSNAQFLVTDSDEITSFVVNFKNDDGQWDASITIPESAIDSIKGKYVDFTVEKSSLYPDAYEVVMKVGSSVSNGDLTGSSAYVGDSYITLSYDSKQGDPSVTWVQGGESMEIIEKADGKVTFKTTHNSTYQITYTPVRDWTPVIVCLVFVILAAVGAGLFWRKSRGE